MTDTHTLPTTLGVEMKETTPFRRTFIKQAGTSLAALGGLMVAGGRTMQQGARGSGASSISWPLA